MYRHELQDHLATSLNHPEYFQISNTRMDPKWRKLPNIRNLWVKASNGEVPPGAFCAGDGVYVGRMHLSDELIPGSVIPRMQKASVSWGGEEFEFEKYEVLCNHGQDCFTWEQDEDGHVPPYAVVGGIATEGAPMYIARTKVDGLYLVGKIHPGHRCAYFPYKGCEKPVPRYDVLIWKSR